MIIGCGIYSIRGESLKTRIRGFRSLSKIDLFDMIKSQHKQNQIEIQVTQNITPLTSIIQKIPDQMNFIVDKMKSIDINFDTKRIWSGHFKNAGHILETQFDSSPLYFID